MGLTTPQALITFGLRANGILGVGQSALAEDYQDAFSALNGMIAQWNVRRWMIYHEITESLATDGRGHANQAGGSKMNPSTPPEWVNLVGVIASYTANT